ncbi:MAG: hypothetical protein AB3N14_18605 [Flavobacteriaceae bacterium]
MLEIGYVLLSLIMTKIILFGYNYGLKKTGKQLKIRRKRVLVLGLGLCIWFVYILLIASSGFLQDFSLPPRFPIFLIFPAFIFTGVVLYKYRNSEVLTAIPKSWAVYYQTFRIVIESLFVGSVAAGLLHPEVTFEGYNYDIIFGFSAPVVGFMVFNRNIWSSKVALYWNYFGLAVISFIIFLFITTIFIPSFWGETESLAPLEIMTFPFVLVPAFLMPSAVFMHIMSIIQLTRPKQ